MARKIRYKYKKIIKEIPFAFDRYNDIFEAVAAAEGIDLTAFHAMEQQVAATTRDKKALKDFRINSFARMGLTEIAFVRDDQA